MKPLKLIINGFITYKGKEEIDFRHFGEAALFMISGPTGAGKTTIFDAISYALYGKTTSSERGEDQLRCQYLKAVPEDSVTYVELMFSSNGQCYRIKRQPAYQKMGNKSITPAKATLYDAQEQPIATKIDQVNKKIVEIIGLNADQFKKIVLLPQGEFRKFLNANSSEKKAILRKLFGTEIYDYFLQEVKSRKNQLLSQMEEKEKRINIELEHLDESSLEKVKELIVADSLLAQHYPQAYQLLNEQEQVLEESRGQLSRELEQIKAKLEQEKRKIEKAKIHNKDLDLFQQKSADLKALQAKKEHIEALATANDMAIRASELAKIEKQLTQKQKQIKAEAESNASLKKKIDNLLPASEQVQVAYSQLSEQKKERDTILTLLQRQEQDVTTYQQLAVKEQALTSKREQLKTVINDLEALNKENGELISQQKLLAEELQTMAELDAEIIALQEKRLGLEKQLQQKTENLDFCQNTLSTIQQYQILEEELVAINQQINQQQQVIELKRSEYELKEKLRDKAVLLEYAQDLADGQPCPLCGSKSHPQIFKAEDIISKQDLKQLSLVLSKGEKELLELKHKLESKQSIKVELDSQIEAVKIALDLATSTELANDIKAKISDLQAVLEVDRQKQAEYQTTIKDKKRQQELRDSLLKNAEALKEKLERITEKQQSYQLAKAKLESQLEQLTAEISSQLSELGLASYNIENEEKLSQQLAVSKAKLEELTAHINAVENEYREITKQLQTAQASYQAKTDSLKQRQKEYQEQASEFEQTLLAEFEQNKDYKVYCKSEEQLASDKEAVAVYYQQKIKIEQSLEDLEQRLDDKKSINIAQLEDIAKELSTKAEEISQQIVSDKQKLVNLKRLMVAIKASLDDGALLEKKEVLAKLEHLFQRNQSGKTLESYVLSYYFQQMLAFANQRLYKMTDGQYSFYHKDDNFKGGAYDKGLELEILDANIGKRRNTTSLSGGEGFLASLALALGLSDAIMNQSGQVEVETLFIDEGFATLDSDKLQNAINCLLELSDSHRLIGIISHLEELKQEIQNKIVVEYQRDKGSTISMQY